MYALPRTPAIQHASPVLNSYFEHALTNTTRMLPSTRLASTPSAGFTVSSPKNTTNAVFRSTNRPGTPVYTPPLCTQSYFPTLSTVHDKPATTPHNTPFFNNMSTFSSSPKFHSARFEDTRSSIIVEETETDHLSTHLSGLGIGNLLESESTVFPSAINNSPFTRKRQVRPSFAHRISNMPLPELSLPKMRRAESNVSTGSATSERTIKAGKGEEQQAAKRPVHIRWDSKILGVHGSALRKGTPHPGKTSWIEDDESA